MEMRGDKAPGPDGFTMAFWQDCWDVVKDEVMDLFKEFFEYGSFAKSLNTTFLVLIPKKGGAMIWGTLGQLVCLGILDASLVANEVLSEDGIWVSVGGMDEVVYFYRQILYINQWGSSCFFSNSKGLRQGDPLSPYLFVLGCRMRGRGGDELTVSHLLFADDTLIFCKARREQLTNLSWILAWFEAASGLRINLAKSVLIPVGEVDEMEELAAELGCKLGALPAVYLGLPLGANHKNASSWDGVEERMRRRLAQWKRQYISKRGRITLIKSTLASIPIYLLSLIRIPKVVAKGLKKSKEISCGGEEVWRGKLI
ncbi:hypothetical protein CK203_067823 [Vitis vinifera]|uniref:Reverse transcriptase domain-containing protein n=1 Tax=Vitis vinifera TaxID=29760 RepID=A0A438BZI4_VITVI|nr:hypothetical protein CK203_067823 [Vitis vinifera]